jgi:hypothetical protein
MQTLMNKCYKALFFLSFVLFSLHLQAEGEPTVSLVSQSPCPDGYCVVITISEFPFIPEPTFTEDPYYSVFIEYGDGTFEVIETPKANSPAIEGFEHTFEHTYATSDLQDLNRRISVDVTSVKIDGPKPPRTVFNITIPKTNSVQSPGNFPSYVSPNDIIDILSNWELGLQVEDELTVIAAKGYSQPFEGVLELHFHNDHFALTNPNNPGPSDPLFGRSRLDLSVAPGAPLINSHIGGYYDKKLSWTYSLDSLDEHLIFTDFKATPSIEEGRRVYFKVTLSELGDDSREIMDEKVLILGVDASRDPNAMQVSPDTVIRSQAPVELTYTIDFFNEGNGAVNDIIIRTKLPGEVDPTTLEHHLAFIRRDSVVPVGGGVAGPILNVNYDEVINGLTDEITWTFSNADLRGLGEGLIDPRDSEGRVSFKVKTSADLTTCTQFSTLASIKFGIQTPINTKEATVTCRDENNSDKSGNSSTGMWCFIFLAVLIIFLIIIWLTYPKAAPTK